MIVSIVEPSAADDVTADAVGEDVAEIEPRDEDTETGENARSACETGEPKKLC